MDAEENPFDDGQVPPDFRGAGRNKFNLRDPTKVDRQPPHSIEGEQGVIGCCFLSPSECIPVCIDKFQDRSDVFYDLRHRTIYEVLVEMYDAQKPVDVITVQGKLRDRKKLEEIGGVAYLASLPDAVPSAANLGYYVDIVREKHSLRQVIGLCTETVGRAYECNGEVPEFIDGFGHDTTKVLQSITGASNKVGVRSAKQLVPLANETMDRLYQKKETVIGLSTGFVDWDTMTLGLHPGEVSVIAARPSVGKSSIAMNIADYVGAKLKQPVGIFSLEMPAEQLMLRMICSRAEVNLRNVMSGQVKADDFPKLTKASAELVSSKIYIDDSRGLSILQAKAKARQMAQQYGIKLFIFDYLQLLHSSSHRAQNREQEVGDVSQGIHDLAGELNAPIILLAQLNREVERQGGRRPRLSDLRESGRIEQDADFVGMLYRATQQSDDDYWANTTEAVPVNLLVAKQRNGPTGEIPLVFMRAYTRFRNAVEEKSDDPAENWPGANI